MSAQTLVGQSISVVLRPQRRCRVLAPAGPPRPLWYELRSYAELYLEQGPAADGSRRGTAYETLPAGTHIRRIQSPEFALSGSTRNQAVWIDVHTSPPEVWLDAQSPPAPLPPDPFEPTPEPRSPPSATGSDDEPLTLSQELSVNDPARIDVGAVQRHQQAKAAKEATLKGIARIVDNSENMSRGQLKRALARVIGAGIDAATDTGPVDAVDDLPIQRGLLKIFDLVENLLNRSPDDLEARAQELLELAQEKRQRQSEGGRGNGR